MPSRVIGSGRAWPCVLFCIAGALVLPLGALGWLGVGEDGEGIAGWAFVLTTIVPQVGPATLGLIAGVGIVVLVVGCAGAWLVSMCEFYGRAVFDWALVLPLAIPTYLAAYAWVEVVDVSSPSVRVIAMLGGWSGLSVHRALDLRNLPGAIFVMSLVLYPYVYLAARAVFLTQSTHFLDVSGTLGAGPWRTFWRVSLPMARPALVVGLFLAVMECLNDIGAVEFFGVKTLTLSVFTTWLHRGNLGQAVQIALVVVAIVLSLRAVETRLRRDRSYAFPMRPLRAIEGRFVLTSWRGCGASLACAVPLILGFVVPVLVLVSHAIRRLDQTVEVSFLRLVMHSFGLSVVAALVTVSIGFVLAYGIRIQHRRLARLPIRLAGVGYAVPGAVLAIGVFVPLIAVDGVLNDIGAPFGWRPGLVISSGLGALIYAYAVRFTGVALGHTEAGFARGAEHLDMAARTLGRSPWQVLTSIHLPLLRPALLTAALIVAVDVLKELPMTLILRAFDFDTLATHVYERVSAESFEDAAPAALVIVLVSAPAVIWLSRVSRRVLEPRV